MRELSSDSETEGVSYDKVEYFYDTRGNTLSKTYSLNGETVDTVTYGYGDTADGVTLSEAVADTFDSKRDALSAQYDATAQSNGSQAQADYIFKGVDKR